MPVNAQGYYASQDDLPANVKALGDARVDLWRKVYNAAVDQHAPEPGVMAWGAVTVKQGSGTPAVFRWLPQSKQHKEEQRDDHGRFTVESGGSTPKERLWSHMADHHTGAGQFSRGHGPDATSLATMRESHAAQHQAGANHTHEAPNGIATGEAATFERYTKKRQLDNDSHDSSQAGRDREPADVDNANAVSPNMAEAASLGNNTTDPEEDAPETQMREQFAKPVAKPQSPGKPPAAL